MTEKYECRYMPDPRSKDTCGARAQWTVHIPGGGYMPVCSEHVVEFQQDHDQSGLRRKGRRHDSGKRFLIEHIEDTQARMEQQREMKTAPLTIKQGMSMSLEHRIRHDNSTVREKPEPEARECLLPGCTNLTTHRGGYCCPGHRAEHASIPRRST